jgi:anti-sigma-K factor RskA
MNLLRPELLDRLAAEFVLGTLRGGARRRFVKLLRDSPAVREAVVYWQERLLPLADQAGQLQPPDTVWRGIERRLFGAAAARASWWQRLGLWQGGAALASALALVFGLLLLRSPAPPGPPPAEVLAASTVYVAALKNTAGEQTLVVSLLKTARDPNGTVQIEVVAATDIQTTQVLQLWSIPRTSGAPPRSLGLLPARGRVQMPLADPSLFDAADALAVSVEPTGGSTTGLPTGPVILQGKLIRL